MQTPALSGEKLLSEDASNGRWITVDDEGSATNFRRKT